MRTCWSGVGVAGRGVAVFDAEVADGVAVTMEGVWVGSALGDGASPVGVLEARAG